MEEDRGKKKYRYTYYTATGKEEIEMDENWYEILRQADRDMYNNNRREEYKSYDEIRIIKILKKIFKSCA